MTALLLVLLALLAVALYLRARAATPPRPKREIWRPVRADAETAAELVPAARLRARQPSGRTQDLDRARLLHRRHQARQRFASLLAEHPIPGRYGQDQVMLWPKDPWWVYAWWELARPVAEGAQQVLRVYDLSLGAGPDLHGGRYWDIPIGPGDDHWFIHVALADHRYQVELGWLDEDGRFRAVARSNVVTTPADGPAGWGEPAIWSSLLAGGLAGESSLSLLTGMERPGPGGRPHG